METWGIRNSEPKITAATVCYCPDLTRVKGCGNGWVGGDGAHNIPLNTQGMSSIDGDYLGIQ